MSKPRTHRRAPLACVLGAALLLRPAAAAAQSDTSSTIAEALFREGTALLKDGKTKEACEKLSASQRMEPALGTLLNLAVCHEKEGKTATAWAEFAEVVSLAQRAGDTQRERYARQRSAALEKQIHRVMIEIASPAKDMEVVLDGQPFDRAALGTAIPLDPGEHTVEVRAPGKKTWSRKINLGPSSGLDRLEVPPLEDEQETASAAPPPPNEEIRAPAVAPVLPVTSPASEARDGATGSSKRTLGYVSIGVGAAALGAATYFALTALGHANERDALCAPDVPCRSQDAFDEHDEAERAQTLMFVTGAAGIVAAGVGAYLVISSPRSSGARVTARPAFGPRGGGLSVGGVF